MHLTDPPKVESDYSDIINKVDDIVAEPRHEPKNKPVLQQGRQELTTNFTTSLNTNGREVKMVPIQISETVSVVQLPNYEERTVSSSLDISSMQRFNDKVNLEPVLSPVHFADTMICYKDSTRKRHISRTFYEPRVKPRCFSNTIFVYPKRPEKSYSSLVDYHIEECRRWFKTCMEFKAKTFTTTKLNVLNNNQDNVLVNGLPVDSVQPGSSTILLPNFPPKDDDLNNGEYEKKIYLKRADINMNDEIKGGY